MNKKIVTIKLNNHLAIVIHFEIVKYSDIKRYVNIFVYIFEDVDLKRRDGS